MKKKKKSTLSAAPLPEGQPILSGNISRWAGAVLGGGLTLGTAAFILLVLLLDKRFPLPAAALCGGAAGVWAAAGLYLPFYCRSCRFTLGEGYIEFTCGIFFQLRRRMRLGAVTALSELRTPFSSLTGTRTLHLSAMGGGLVLPMLRRADAETVEGYILLKMGKAGDYA